MPKYDFYCEASFLLHPPPQPYISEKATEDPLLEWPEGHDKRFDTFVRQLDPDNANAQSYVRSLVQVRFVASGVVAPSRG